MLKIFTRLALLACFVAPGPAGLARAQSLRPGWGATPYAAGGLTGVTFRVWAPLATNVSVAGIFNGWNNTAHPLVLESTTSGVWSVDVAAARTNQSYKYVINGTLWRSDPRSRVINGADNDNSIITSTNTFTWNGDRFSITNASDLVIYEAHVGVFTGPGGTFSSFTNRLDYLNELGVSALEFMPINEFPSATSWGYNPAYPFAVESNYGSPDSLKTLIQQAHQHDLLTLIDVVHNHWDGGSALWQLDGSTPGPYFYPNAPYALTLWGPRPDYSRAEVREYINDTFRMWLDEYHISGFRWDAPRHSIYTTNEIYIPDGMLMITNALALMATNYPGTWNIAEDTKEISGFNYFWDFTFHSEIKSVLTQSDDNFRDMPTVARNVGGLAARIIYTESHDTAGDLNQGVRLTTAIHSTDPTGYYARKRSALGAVLVMTSPGTPMILQGQELLETNQFSDTRSMDWSRTNSQAGTLRLYRDLIRLRRNLDGVSGGLRGEAASVYRVDNVNKLVAFSRTDSANTGNTVVVVANFANTTRTGYALQFPEAGTWYALFNSDATNYASDYSHYGSTEVAAAGTPPVGLIDVAPYSALIFSRTPRSGLVLLAQENVDQPAGNNDATLDPGETIRSRIVLLNKSQFTATNLQAHLVCDTPGVTVLQGDSGYPVLAPDAIGTNTTWFEYQIAPTQACGSVLAFRLLTTFNGQSLTSVLDQVVGRSLQLPSVTNVFLSSDVPKPMPDLTTTYSTLTINETGSNTIRNLRVQVRLNHTYDRDLTLALQHPDGSEVILASRRGGSGDNYGSGAGSCGTVTYTVFDQSAATAIRNGTAPFAGSYRPEGSLATFNGKPLNGTWRLRILDGFANNAGTALCWGVRATYEQSTLDCTTFSNRPPVVTGTNLFLAAGLSTNFHLQGSDPDGQPVQFVARTSPGHGLLSVLTPSNGLSRYQPVYGYHGTDSFDFVASDGLSTSGPAAVSIVIAPPADTNTNGLPDTWEETHFTNLNAALTHEDADGDGADNEAEFWAHTDPQDSNSVLRLISLEQTSGWYALRWNSTGGTRYALEVSPGLENAPFQLIAQPMREAVDAADYGVTSVMSFVDDFTLTPPPATNLMRVYRVRVLNE